MLRFLNRHAHFFDLVLLPLTIAATATMWVVRQVGIERLPRTLAVFRRMGIFPLRDHYYEPLFNPVSLRHPLRQDRNLPGLDMNVTEQLDLLKKFDYNGELVGFPVERRNDLEFFYGNDMFGSGDAEYLYNMIRFFKPQRLIEIGSGQSTLLAAGAVRANQEDDEGYECRHICIEPYEAPWLDKLGVEILRERVESVDQDLFRQLEENDILFIDSSHMIRPQGDVLHEYLEILPILKSGVLVHVHDIFTPKDYLDDWISKQVLFWNEQYLLEAFLSFNKEFKVIGALNFLKHRYPEELASCCPVLREQIDVREPGSFWMQRV